MMTPRSLARCAAEFATGAITSRQLVEECLAAASNESGEGARTFIELYRDEALRQADAIDAQANAGFSQGPLAGMPVSLKDLFDVKGETTRAGSVILANAPPASRDADVVARLKAAGAVLIGRTNMTEFAYSGLGLNPHYGTPRNPHDRKAGRIPGGSSSGAAVSVADGMALGAIGTDTGGSVRIPAALCGLTGFKPTARRVPLSGVVPLSPSLDSVGPIAHDVASCALLDGVLSGSARIKLNKPSLGDVKLGVIQGYVVDDLEPPVARAFTSALTSLSAAGARLSDAHFSALAHIQECGRNGGIAAAESYSWHRSLLEERAAGYDPHVLTRILSGKAISSRDYSELLCIRREIIQKAQTFFNRFDAVLMPSVPRIAPEIASVEKDDSAYFNANAAMLRNPSVINFVDGCALTIPCHFSGDAPVGLTLAAPAENDEMLLEIGISIEASLADAGFSTLAQLV